MRRFVATLFAGLLLAVLVPTPGSSADVIYGVTIDGRGLDAKRHSAINHDGVIYVNVVRAVRAFDGLLAFGRGGSLRITIDGRILHCRIGSVMAQLENGGTVKLTGAPFVYNGDTYVPVASIATLAMARYTVDTKHHVVRLTLGANAASEPAPTMPPETSEETSDLSPLQALTITPSATADALGLHARAEIVNTTSKPYVMAFAGSQQFVFVVVRNGSEAWTSQSSSAPPGPSKFRLDAGATTTVTSDWPGFAKAGPGRYSLRVRLLRAIPIDTPPVSLDALAPGPPSPTP
jgi:hypothetical protein